MLPKETANLEKQRSKLFFFIDQHFENGNKNIQRNTEKFCDNFKEFAIKIKVTINSWENYGRKCQETFQETIKRYSL